MAAHAKGANPFADTEDQAALRQLARDVAERELAPMARHGDETEEFPQWAWDGMRKAEQTSGERLLDVLDVHWYPEARGDNRIVDATATTTNDAAARLHDLLARRVAPPPVVHPKCKQCSLHSVCLPELVAAPAAYRRAASAPFRASD